MNKIILSITAAAVLTLSCTNGSATTPENSSSVLDAVETANPEKGGDDQTEAAGKTVKLNKQDFLEKVMNYEKNQTEWVYEGDLPALIDFYADWCGPCKIAAPILEELAEEYKGKIHIYKIDTQVEQELASVFGIQSIPAFLFIPKDGKPTMSNGIAQTPEETKKMFKQMIDEILLAEKSAQQL
jgi:thioredoxin 1